MSANAMSCFWCGGMHPEDQCPCPRQGTTTPRKVIQIAAVGETETAASKLVALCNDGTLWVRTGVGRWWQIEAPPAG